MARWKLSRLTYGNEEFTFLEGDEVSLGRGISNTISLSSIVVSRNHCLIKVEADSVILTDLKSSNGIYVGLKKIPPNVPVSVEDSDIIGIGWTNGAPVANIKDNEKYVFKLTKEKPPPLTSRLTFQSDNEGDIEAEVIVIDGAKSPTSTLIPSKLKNISDQKSMSTNEQTPINTGKSLVKRKFDNAPINMKVKIENGKKYRVDKEIISILSDSESDVAPEQETICKKQKLAPNEDPPPTIKETDIKTEKEDLEYDAFKIKQEYCDAEPIQIDSESDDESANWLIRLSQSSPGKPFIKAVRGNKTAKLENEESSYSQIDDFDEDFLDDPISIPAEPPEDKQKHSPDSGVGDRSSEQKMHVDEDEEEYLEDLISLHKPDDNPPLINEDIHVGVVDNNSNNTLKMAKANTVSPELNLNQKPQIPEAIAGDVVDGSSNNLLDLGSNTTVLAVDSSEKNKKALVIDAQPLRSKSTETRSRSLSSSSKHSKEKKHKNHLSSKRHITDSQKEERKKKLKDIATKEKEENDRRLNKHSSSSRDKSSVNAKITNTNRGAFLTDIVQGVVKPIKRKEIPRKLSSSKEKVDEISSNMAVVKDKDYSTNKKTNSDDLTKSVSTKETIDDIENKKKRTDKHNSSKHKAKDKSSKEHKYSKHIEKHESSKAKSSDSKSRKSSTEARIPLKSLKPLTESEDSFSGKPFSIVEPMPSSSENSKISTVKKKKTVRFSERGPEIHIFEIEEGNKMKKTSLVKTSLVDVRQAPVFSLEKITLMRILRWNPQWLEEQMATNDPPPILGCNHPPMAIFHSFNNHNQYVQVVGDLLLMEIWECLTQGYLRIRNQTTGIQMRIDSLPPISSQDRCFELFNLSVNVSVPTSEIRSVPRTGEIILVSFGPETARNKRFFYVHSVRTIPSPPNNKNTFFCISLQTCYTDKMKSLKQGELLIGMTLSYIQKELALFEAMEHLAGSPLSEAILRPEPRYFTKCDPNAVYPQSQWTKTLNPSQRMAVHSSVSAALSDRPNIQMVQGPPGTGKSSVICAMVMSYFYDGDGRRLQNRGKILICATSNAAVDELVIKLLNIRQDLPKSERFRMVRVGRAEAMHHRAHVISSQQLAQRDAAARQVAEPTHPGLSEEISHLEAKINMWKTQELDAKDPVRAAYCKNKVKGFVERIALLQGGGGGGAAGGGQVSPEQLLTVERRIIEGAHIIATTLSSALNHKMRGLRRRIALCIVDEAGQAIEPETLIPLTLDVTRLTLVGDPQQLPGFICSQRAKKHGLGESLFYRLTSCADQWGEGCSPVILLNQQYRMHPDIADYPNRAFYGSLIQSMPPPRPNIDIPAYSIVCISSGDKGQGSSGANEMEAWGVARLVLALGATLRPLGLSLAVITPYNAHKDLIKRNLRLLQDPSEGQVEVNTVDSFQGQERDVVVVSLARSQGVGFLTDTGRMNVMLTRARHALLLCLNPLAMLKNYQWRTLIEDAQKRNLYRTLPHKFCQGVSAGPIPHSDLLKHITQAKTSYKK